MFAFQNLTTESGSKQRFSLLQEKVIIQVQGQVMTQGVSIKALFQKGGLWEFKKSQKQNIRKQ